ncbi:hypothetical protein FZC83_02285 [Rossellomorea marisflavi]|uniref:RNA dependent RNA polymerase n=1 Tax=Rossellomorea marisflavi TaxID=189381 RepID=A0A5D4RYF5_9BACI|nr:hypothetical protein [Rossellomorea marisflavi]TYS56425.1 hypothetical protein FZC83_02285 [Rossellomorea marisflavi]
MNKTCTYKLIKITIQQLIKSNFDLSMSENEAKDYLIQQNDTPLFRQLSLIRGCDSKIINELIYVEAKHNKKRLPDLKKMLKFGFIYNNKKYVRFGKSSSQAKDGITVFIEDSIHANMLERSQLGVPVDQCVISKYESYRSLILSSCQIVDEDIPYIVIMDEYEKTIPNQHVRYAEERDVTYVDKVSGEKKVAKKQRFIKEGNADIKISPFDGFGVHTEEISKKFSKYIKSDHESVLFQIRLPFMKGVTVETDFKQFYKDREISKIKDVFGKWHDIDKIDCIWNTTMFKGYGIFQNAFGSKGWTEYISRVKKYGFKVGISKYNHHVDEINEYSRLNFQYVQCLDLQNPKYLEQFKSENGKYDILDENNWGKVINVAKYSTDMMEKIIKGEKLHTLKFLGINNTLNQELRSKYAEAILINDSMLKDPAIKKMLKRKLTKSINQMKYGKIYASGFYHTVVGDIIGYLEYCGGLEVEGCLKYGEFHANTLPLGDCLSLRSPLVDPSEVNKIKLVENELTEKFFSHFKDKDICMINMYDLTMQQQGGMDEDGDAVFLTDEKILIDSKIDKPIVVDMQDKISAKPVDYDIDNIVNYECNSRDNRIGEITNIATAILNQHTENEKWKKINEDNISMLRLYQGKEIDFVKTGYRWVISKNLRKYLKKLPYFLLYNYPKKLTVYNRIKEINKNNSREDRIAYNAFRSPSAMNELCDYINQWERKCIDWDRSLINNGHLLVDNSLVLEDKSVMKSIKKVLNTYNDDLRDALDNDQDVEKLMQDYKKSLLRIVSDEKLLSNYCIKVSYRGLSTDKTLCWMIFGDEMIRNLRENSDERKELELIRTHKDDADADEFLGKYYKLINKGL